MISIHWNKHNIDYVKHNDLNGTKVKILTFTLKTHYHELTNTLSFKPKLWFRMLKVYKKELLRFNTHDLRRKKISIFYLHNPLNMIFSSFIWETCKCFDTFKQANIHYMKRSELVITKIRCLHLNVKHILMSWETLFNFVV